MRMIHVIHLIKNEIQLAGPGWKGGCFGHGSAPSRPLEG
jgi:hypothetical protein